MWYDSLCSFWFSNHLAGEVRADCFTLTVSVLCLFLTGRLVGLQSVIEAFSNNTNLLFCDSEIKIDMSKNNFFQNSVFRSKGALARRRIFSLFDMITNTKFSNCLNVVFLSGFAV